MLPLDCRECLSQSNLAVISIFRCLDSDQSVADLKQIDRIATAFIGLVVVEHHFNQLHIAM